MYGRNSRAVSHEWTQLSDSVALLRHQEYTQQIHSSLQTYLGALSLCLLPHLLPFGKAELEQEAEQEVVLCLCFLMGQTLLTAME